MLFSAGMLDCSGLVRFHVDNKAQRSDQCSCLPDSAVFTAGTGATCCMSEKAFAGDDILFALQAHRPYNTQLIVLT